MAWKSPNPFDRALANAVDKEVARLKKEGAFSPKKKGTLVDKIGECVRVSVDRGEYIYGKPIRNVKMKITEILWFTDTKGKETITYCGTALEKGTNNDFHICAEERMNGLPTNRHIIGRAEDNLNTFEKKSDIEQSCDFNI